MEHADAKSSHASSASSKHRLIPLIFPGWIDAFHDISDGIITPLSRSSKPVVTWLFLMLSIVVTWFIYVPIHELLHVAGCVISGGTVTELTMGREYGADLLKHIFPFITPQTTVYAGRVTGFQPNGDGGYLLTVFMPFVITLFPGVWMMKTAIRKRWLWLTGPGVVVGLAPFVNVTGDFFEIGTILSTRLVNFLGMGAPARLIADISASPPRTFFDLLRSDDIFRLFSEISAAPDTYGLDSVPGTAALAAVIIAGALFAVIIAGGTYAAGGLIAGKPSRTSPAPES